jgi:hypothetical protein
VRRVQEPKPIDSTAWRGDIYDPSLQHGQFTYGRGQPGLTSDFSRLLVRRRRAEAKPPEVYPLIFLSLGLLLSPALLLCAAIVLHYWIRDPFLNDNAIWLYAWGFSAIAVGIAGMTSRSTTLLFIRKVTVAAALLATVAFSGWYVHLGVSSHANAQASAPERTLEFIRRCGRKCSEIVHQRADGSTVEGRWAGAPLPYAYSCAVVQRLNGDHNFRWVRVVERSKGDGSSIAWPIRREDCFSTKPVSSLHG